MIYCRKTRAASPASAAQLAELEAKHGKIQEAFAQMHTVPPEQQPGVQQQLLALRQQVGAWKL